MSDKDGKENKNKKKKVSKNKKLKNSNEMQNVINFQEYKKKVKILKKQNSDDIDKDEMMSSMFLMQLDKDFVMSFFENIFLEDGPEELELDDFYYYIVGLPESNTEEIIDVVVAATDLIYDDIDIEDEYEILEETLIETLELKEKAEQENALLKLHIKKLEKKIKTKQKMISEKQLYELKKLKIIRTTTNEVFQEMLEDYLNTTVIIDHLEWEKDELVENIKLIEHERDAFANSLRSALAENEELIKERDSLVEQIAPPLDVVPFDDAGTI